MNITLKTTKNIPLAAILNLYRANHWSSAEKPEQLHQALQNSTDLVSAWDGDLLVGLGSALSDGYLVVYYPHLSVLPDYQGKGIGKMIMDYFFQKYGNFHQQVLVADNQAVDFYAKCGFVKAGNTQAMWIYQGNEH